MLLLLLLLLLLMMMMMMMVMVGDDGSRAANGTPMIGMRRDGFMSPLGNFNGRYRSVTS
jgi:hypothetical protein